MRAPQSDHYLPKSARVAGHAAQVGEQQKHTRYSALAGRSVTAASVETFGCLSREFDQLLLDAASGVCEERRSRRLPVRQPRQRWLGELSVSLAWHAANAILEAHKEAQGDVQV